MKIPHKPKTLFIIYILLFAISCKDKDRNFFKSPKNSKNILISQLNLDSITLDAETSLLGSFNITNDKLYFADSRFCWVYEFDSEGKVIKRNLGQGKGPNELPTSRIDIFKALNNGGFFIMGATNDCFYFDKNWNYIRTEYLDSGLTLQNKSELKSKKDIKGDTKWVYSPSYIKLVVRNYKNSLYYNIQAEHPNFNPITTPDELLDNGRVIAKVNLENSKLIDVIGRISPIYSKNKYLPQFMSTSFDITNKGEFYVCFEADPTIYFYDKDYNILNAFGYSGKNMNLDYEELNTIKKVRKNYISQREKCGYYNWIEFIDETNTLFRSYTKGKDNKNDGLQIYKNSILVADIEVPKGFKISGYIAPYYYSDVIVDFESESMKIYKFKLNIN